MTDQDPRHRSWRRARLPVPARLRRPGARDFAQLAGRGLLLQLVLLASGPVVARILGPDGRGELALAMTVGMMMAQLSSVVSA